MLYVSSTFQGLGQILELTSRNPGNSFSPFAMLYRGRDYKNQIFREKGVGNITTYWGRHRPIEACHYLPIKESTPGEILLIL
jgi:hypothetical protein